MTINRSVTEQRGMSMNFVKDQRVQVTGAVEEGDELFGSVVSYTAHRAFADSRGVKVRFPSGKVRTLHPENLAPTQETEPFYVLRKGDLAFYLADGVAVPCQVRSVNDRGQVRIRTTAHRAGVMSGTYITVTDVVHLAKRSQSLGPDGSPQGTLRLLTDQGRLLP